MQNSDFKFEVSVQMRWSDVDHYGHVNNATFVTYFETARIHYLLKVTQWDWQQFGMVVVNLNIDYVRPLEMHDKTLVAVKCIKMGNSSITFEYALYDVRKEEKKLCAKGTTTMVMISLKDNATISIPETIRKTLSDYESL